MRKNKNDVSHIPFEFIRSDRTFRIGKHVYTLEGARPGRARRLNIAPLSELRRWLRAYNRQNPDKR